MFTTTLGCLARPSSNPRLHHVVDRLQHLYSLVATEQACCSDPQENKKPYLVHPAGLTIMPASQNILDDFLSSS
jgi:hypothetical protein